MEICVKTYDRDSISKDTIEVDYVVIGGTWKSVTSEQRIRIN